MPCGTAEAELFGELIERRTGLIAVLIALSRWVTAAVVAIFIDLDADRYDRRFDLGDEVGEACRGLRVVSAACADAVQAGRLNGR